MPVEISRDGHVATVRLNRPEKLNALNEEMREQIIERFQECASDPSVRAIILTGSGRGFCSSGDVSSMGNFTPETARSRLRQAHRMILAVANIDKPVVAAVRGPAAGIGWSLALACDLVVASTTAKFIQVFRNVGLVPDGGSVYFLTQILGVQRAKEIVYSARPVLAAEALAQGLVTEVVPDDELDTRAADVAARLAAGPRLSFAISKKMFKSMYLPTLENFLDTEAWAQTSCLLGAEHREGVNAFFEKRPPDFIRMSD